MLPLLAETFQLFSWPPHTLWEAALASALFGVLGILLAILGFKLFDWVIPADIHDEIFKKNNLAAAIVTGAFLIGICIVIAAAIG